jgi:hypothetical protein
MQDCSDATIGERVGYTSTTPTIVPRKLARGGGQGFHVVACMASLNHAPCPAPLFIEHANGLCHHRPISTLIRLESNPWGP